MIFSYISHIPHNIIIYTSHTRDKPKHRRKYKRIRHGRPGLPFSVSINDAITDKALIVLSAIRIASSWCPPAVQYMIKCIIFTKRARCLQASHRHIHTRSKLLRFFLLPLLFFSHAPSIHAMPGTNHSIIKGQASLDIARQQKYIKTIIDKISNDSNISSSSSSTNIPPPSQSPSSASVGTRTEPFCFIVDTDSVPYVIDTGANRIIVNDARYLRNLVPTSDKIKGIGGKCIRIAGTGILKLPLRSDNGHLDMVSNLQAVYVPSCPYNLIPPQILINQMKHQGFRVNYFKHNDKEYIFEYFPPSTIGLLNPRHLTVPVGENNLFTLRTNVGYKHFMSRAPKYFDDFKNFAGAAHLITDDDSSVPPYIGIGQEKTRESPEKPREPPDKTRELPVNEGPTRYCPPCNIPFDDTDFEPLKSTPISEDFTTCTPSNTAPGNDAMNQVRKKQFRLLTIHERLGHVSFSILKLMARCRLIPQELADVDPPCCPGCAYGKAHKKPTRYKGWRNNRSIKPSTSPGGCVSVDQLVSPTPGFVPTHRGYPTLQRYKGATVFVDHFSDFTYVHLMTEMNGATTVEAKQAFERLAHSHNVAIKHYHCDNGLFDTRIFKQSIEKANQTISFCGVNAHHQNGRAERRIKDITEGSRTSLLHASHRWPKAVHPSLWPCALKHYVNLRNNLPSTYIPGGKNGRKKLPDTYINSPLSKFSGFETAVNLQHFHPFGSPVYVLENKLQASQSHNKWADRSRVGIFLQHSPDHSSSVPLVLNTSSGNVSPQFHCIYDDEFATCRRDVKFQSVWQAKARLSSDDLSTIIKPPLIHLPTTVDFTPDIQHCSSPPTHTSTLPSAFQHQWDPVSDTSDDTIPAPDIDIQDAPQPPDLFEALPLPEIPDDTLPVRTTRTGRVIRAPQKFADTAHSSIHAFLSTFCPPPSSADVHLLQPQTANYSEPHPLALLSSYIFSFVASDPDTMTLAEAMSQPDRQQFIQAMKKELNDHISRGHWKVIPSKFVPSHKRCLPMVWSMKRKRNPIGEIIKWKARLCAGGHRSMEFVDYWDTYSPVVSWQTIRLVFVLAIVNNWHIHSIDFVMAFPQADIKTDIYLQPPRVPSNFTIPDLPLPNDRFSKVYKLLKNLYGLKDAGRTWNHHLRSGLLKRGWKQCPIDECLFIKPGLLLILYVDDACIISHNKLKIQHEITSLQKDYDLTDDGELQDYIGTRFERHSNGSVTLTQPRMIDRLLTIVGLDSTDTHIKLHDTPANAILQDNANALPREQKWHYRSAVGCLSYIQSIVRPDITFAVQQCARFCNNPNRDHEEAVKRIARYLLNTKTKGLVLKPDKTRGLECHVDADFAGAWTQHSSLDPLSCHSRTGFMISYAGCPILWKSKVQSLIALSTTEAEYIALSSALREVITIIHLLDDLKSNALPIHGSTPIVKCRTFEDNMSCVKMANNHKNRPRTKHLSLRLHHFRSHIIRKIITVEHISTKEQIADIFTKPLPKHQFCKLRDPLMSWET